MTERIYSAGQLTQKVQFEVRSSVEDALGEVSGEWVNDGLPVWARVKPLRGGERIQAGALQQPVDTLVVVRFSSSRTDLDIMARNLRIRWKGRVLGITAAVLAEGGREWIEIQCSTGAADVR
ncbi:phage head closure protein [Roseateles sp.]|uniref:phage head closure protein n=1 Tax=Roseateles sp. TaxID=1971397 RepID=UPI002F3EEBBE